MMCFYLIELITQMKSLMFISPLRKTKRIKRKEIMILTELVTSFGFKIGATSK